jgi:predicted nuclease of restriction endonuclease-like (RecB) superfamily
MDLDLTDNYKQVLESVKERIRQAQYAALKAVNKELIRLYWDIGRMIVEQQEQNKWGESVVEQLARDLHIEFEGVSGFSFRNLWYMRKMYLTYRANPKLPPLVAEIGWAHNRIILDKCKDDFEREFYLKVCKQLAWSKQTLIDEITNKAYERFLARQTNFDRTLTEEQQVKSVLAVKDDYNFDFLGIEGTPLERELETALVANITKFLAEMGGYFAFVGRQFRITVSDDEYFIDLLFYHRYLKCLVAVEIKTGEFLPEYAGKMMFYLSALDDTVRVEGENPSIGIIICRSKDRTKVEYTLRESNRPIGVASFNHYSTLKDVPARISKYLPSPEELQKRLSDLPG